MTVALNVRVEDELKVRLQREAGRLGVSVSAVVQDILWAALFVENVDVGTYEQSLAPSVVAADGLLPEHRRLTPLGWVDE